MRARSGTVLFAVAAALGLTACGAVKPSSGETATSIYPGAAQAFVGGGALRFIPIADGQSVPIIHGSQGGYHVWASVRLRYMSPKGLNLTLRATLDDTGEVINTLHVAVPADDVSAIDPACLTVGTPALPAPADGPATSDGAADAMDAAMASPDLHAASTVDAANRCGDAAPWGIVPDGTDGWIEVLSQFLYLSPPADSPAHVANHRLRVRIDAVDGDGRSASDERIEVPYCTPGESC